MWLTVHELYSHKGYIVVIIIPPYANKVNCAMLLVKSKETGENSLDYLAFGPIVQVLSTPWADSTMVLSAKVNCCPWVTVHFALGTTVLRNKISLGIYVHTPDRHGRQLYFKQIMTFLNQYRNTNNQCY